jgi:hypothetical protein
VISGPSQLGRMKSWSSSPSSISAMTRPALSPAKTPRLRRIGTVLGSILDNFRDRRNEAMTLRADGGRGADAKAPRRSNPAGRFSAFFMSNRQGPGCVACDQ